MKKKAVTRLWILKWALIVVVFMGLPLMGLLEEALADCACRKMLIRIFAAGYWGSFAALYVVWLIEGLRGSLNKLKSCVVFHLVKVPVFVLIYMAWFVVFAWMLVGAFGLPGPS